MGRGAVINHNLKVTLSRGGHRVLNLEFILPHRGFVSLAHRPGVMLCLTKAAVVAPHEHLDLATPPTDRTQGIQGRITETLIEFGIPLLPVTYGSTVANASPQRTSEPESNR